MNGSDDEDASRVPSIDQGFGNFSTLTTILFLGSAISLDLFALVSNSFVIYAISSYAPLKSPSNLYLVSMAVAYLLWGTTNLPMEMYYNVEGVWYFGSAMCKTWSFFSYYLPALSVIHLSAIALDRYCAIIKPLTYGLLRSNRKSVAVLSFLWVGTFAVMGPPFFLDWAGKWPEVFTEETPCAVPMEYGWYFVITSIFLFYTPLIVIVVVYVKLFLINRERLKKRMLTSSTIIDITSKMNSAIHQKDDVSPNNEEEEREEIHTQENAPAAITITIEELHGNPNVTKYLIGSSKRRKMLPNLNVDLNKSLTLGATLNSSNYHLNSQDQIANGSSSPNSHILTVEKTRLQILEQNERHSMFVTFVIICAFLVLWLPGVVVFTIMSSDASNKVDDWIILMTFWMANTNTICSPIVYTIFNKDFRDAFWQIIGGRG